MTLSIEILLIEKELQKYAENSILILNRNQSAFTYKLINDLSFGERIPRTNRLYSEDVYKEVDEYKIEIKGYHPHIICLTNQFLINDELWNLFGDIQRSNDTIPTGNGVFTIHEIKEIIKEIPVEIYLINEFILSSILFLTREQLYHKEKRNCPFDLKMDKGLMYENLRYSNLCLECNNIVRKYVNKVQLQTIRNTLNLISDISHDENPQQHFESIIREINFNGEAEIEKESELDKIRKLVITNQLEKAIEELSLLLEVNQAEKNNELILLYSRLGELRMKERFNILESEKINLELNKIRLGILKMIDNLNE